MHSEKKKKLAQKHVFNKGLKKNLLSLVEDNGSFV